jgi:dolichyl-phosphate-mannose--protein O-mannosyl transferase
VTATLVDSGDAPADPFDAPEPPVRQRPVPAALAPWHDPHPWYGWLVTVLVGALAAGIRFWAVGFPPGKNFDEVYYANQGQEILRYGYEDDRGYMYIVHPPLGKWLIAFTEYLVSGNNQTAWLHDTLGWRLAPAIAGTICVVLITRLARRMFRSTWYGALAGILLSLEGVSVVLSRTAILDIFLQLFVLAAVTALVADREQMRGRLARLIGDGADLRDGIPTLGPRPYRLVAGVMLGAACAIKWSGLYFFLLLALLSLWWDRGALRAGGVRRPWRVMFVRSALPATGPFVVAPVATYLLANLGWFVGENGWNRHWADTHRTAATLHLLGLNVPFNWAWVPAPIRSLGAYILDAYHFHEGLTSGHPSAAGPFNWLVLGRPTLIYYDGSSHACGSSVCSREILLIGTPLMWWAFVPALLWLAWYWFTTRDWRAGLVWVGFIAGWVVWLKYLKRTMFLFYTAPLIPFLILALTMALGTMVGRAPLPYGDGAYRTAWLRRRRIGLAGVATYLGIVVADFIWMWPILTGGLLTYTQWHARMWFDSWVPR